MLNGGKSSRNSAVVNPNKTVKVGLQAFSSGFFPGSRSQRLDSPNGDVLIAIKITVPIYLTSTFIPALENSLKIFTPYLHRGSLPLYVKSISHFYNLIIIRLGSIEAPHANKERVLATFADSRADTS